MRKPISNAALGTNADALVEAALKKPLGEFDLLPLLRVVADVLDLAGSGEDIFLTVGTTRNRGTLVVTVTWDGTKMFATGDNAIDLAIAVGRILGPPPDAA